MEELNTPIFAQAKVEYTAQLIDILYPHMFDGVKSIYDESKILYRSRSKTPILLIFRELLEKVPIWNSEIINSECSRIVNNSNCDYIDDLITAVFISHTKILTSIGPSHSFNKINVTIPKCSTFIHKSYINTARELWKNPYLFNENVPGHEFQKNNKEIENIIKTCIENTIRKLLPIKEILKEHLEGENENNLLNQRETLKQLLREELRGMKSSETPPNTKYEDEEVEEDNESEVDDNNHSTNNSDSNYNVQSEYMGPIIVKESDKEETHTTKEEIHSKEDEISELEKKLTNMVERMEQEPTTEKNTGGEDIVNELFPSTDDPTDEQVEAQCSSIVVNDITVPVEIPDDTSIVESNNPIVEIKYDNVNITENEVVNEDPDRLKRLMTNMEVREEVNVIKSDEVATFQQTTTPEPEHETEPEYYTRSNYSLNSLYPTMNNQTINDNNSYMDEELPKVEIVTKETPTQENIKEDEPVKIIEPKSPRKEMVTVQNEDDIDETSSLANFFDDMKQIVEDKGIVVEKNNNRMFTLFEDANEVER
jgi:hypothetical protein